MKRNYNIYKIDTSKNHFLNPDQTLVKSQTKRLKNVINYG